MFYHEAAGWWFPDGETHLPGWMATRNDQCDGRLLYQGDKFREVLKWTRPERRNAIDVGGHVGLWSWMMLRHGFELVYAFEPMSEHRACYRQNMRDHPGQYLLHHCALGMSHDTVSLSTRTPGSSGDTGIENEGDVTAELNRLDSFSIDRVDLIKLDCEGYELFALKGGEETLLREKPAIIVEQKFKRTDHAEKYQVKPYEAVDYLTNLGFVVRREMAEDFILSWND